MPVCHFSTTEDLKGKTLTYENLKAVALKAGRFSVFESTSSVKRAKLFTQLCADPSVEVFDLGYPWTGIRCRP